MPATTVQRSPPQTKSQFTADFDGKDTEVKGGARTVSTLNANVDEDGAGETVAKKTIKRTAKPDDAGKKPSTTVADKFPKKTAQRAKGTTSLSKAAEKASRDCLDKTKAASGDKVPASKEEGTEKHLKKEGDKGKIEGRKSSDTADKKPKTLPKKPGTKVTKKPSKVAPSVPSQEIAVITQSAEVPAVEIPVEVPNKKVEEPVPEIRVKEPEKPQPTTTNSVGHGLSCSFFERLQLGVKAYFTNRNSFTCADKNKKEGGNRTRGRLGKGVKEDTKKTDPGFKFKNNNYISESDLLFDLLRFISNSGGEKSNFLTNKPNNSQNLKRKKLKHCVSIQIPRKGYFYRSSMQSKIPGQPLTSSLELLEPSVNPRNKSKVKIFGLAPASSEITHIPGQKVVKKTLKNSNKTDTELIHSDDESLNGSFSGISNRSSSSKLLSQWYFDDDRHRPTEKRRSGKIVDLLPEFGERERESRFILENSFSADGQKKKKTAAGVGGDCFEVSEPGRKTSTTLETLTNCINSVLGNEKVIKNLEITPVDIESNRNLQSISGEVKKPLITPVSIGSIYSNTGFGGDINPTAALMGEIDLHLELQNYIKACNNVNISKVRTKNTLNTKESTASKSVPSKPESSKPEFHTEELFEKYEKNTDLRSVQDEFDELEEERIESRLACSQTQLSNILKQMQRTKPNKNEQEGNFLTDKSIDNYDKIFPFGAQPYGELGNSLYSFGESISVHTPTKTLSELQETSKKKKPCLISLNLQDMMEIYENILEEHEKFKRGGRKLSRTSLSSRLVSFLSEKLTRKQGKTNLMKISKEISNREGWKHSEKKIDIKNLEDYTVIYQKLLKSSMSIKQIIYLNSLLADWESHSEEWMKRVIHNLEKTKASEKQAKKLQSVPGKADSLEIISKNKNTSKTSHELEEKSSSSSKNLQIVLESFFNSKGKDVSGLSNIKGKVLVDVKLTGSQIQVNDLSFLNSKIPPRKRADTNETSELIIETLGKSDINELFNEKKPKEKKQMKKPEKPNQGWKEKKSDVEKPKSILQFNYNETQLRTQHPINPISECLETKIFDEKFTSDTSITKKTQLDIDLLKRVLGDKCSLKDFKKKAVGEMPNKINSPIKRTLPVLLKMKPPKKVRSLVDLKTKPVIWKKIQKTPSMFSRTIFCHPILETCQNKRFKGNNKAKKIGGASNTQKKVQEFGIKRQKTNSPGFMKFQPMKPYSPFHETNECSSMEMMISDGTPSKNDLKQSEFLPNLILNEESEIIVNSTKSSILFQSLNNAGDDKLCTLNLIHSDSFLKRISHALFLEKDTKSLFNKNNSDIKFCPVRETKSRERKKPFITFVLTPEQFEKTDIFADDVLLIQRNKHTVAEPFENVLKPEKSDLKEALKSIENFMEILSASNEETKNKNKKKIMERKFCPPSFSERKSKTRCQTCQLLSMQESQKKQKESKKVNTDSRLNVKNLKTEAKKVKSEDTKPFWCRDANQNLKPQRNVTQQKIKIDSDEEKKTKVKFNEATEEFFLEKKNEIEKTKCENFSKISQNIENILLSELFETVKNSVNQVDDFKKKPLMTTIEEDLEKKEVEEKKWEDVETLMSFELKTGNEHPEFLKKIEEVKNEKVEPEEEELLEPSSIHEPINLEKKDSMYFDAVERKDTIGDETEEMESCTKQDPPGISAPQNKNFNLVPTTTKANPTSEEFILNQISDSLLEGQINYSLAMLNSFLRKKEKILLKKEKINNLGKLIEIVEENTECTMTNLERTAWEKVLVFLDSLYQIMDGSAEENIKAHLKATKNLVSNILRFNVSRLDDLHKFNLSVTQMGSGNDSDSFGVIKQCLTHFKEKLGLENEKTNEGKNESRENEEDLMTKSSRESVLSEFRELKNKLVEEMKSVEKLFLVSDLSRSSSSSGENGGVIGSEDRRIQSEDWLNRTYGCMHLMQCLMKVWETRMSLIAYPKDCFH